MPVVPVVIIVVVPSLSLHTAIRNTDIQWPVKPETEWRISGNSDSPSANLAAIDGSDNRSNQAVVARRFYAIGVGLHRVPLAVDGDRLQIQNQIVISLYADNEFRR